MRNFKKFCVYAQKSRPITKAGSVSELVSSAADSRLKNLSIAMDTTGRTTRILLRGVNKKKKIFAPELSDLSPVLNKQMQLKRVIDGA